MHKGFGAYIMPEDLISTKIANKFSSKGLLAI